MLLGLKEVNGTVIRRYSVLTVIFLHLAFFCGAPGTAYAFILGDSNGDNLLNLADPVYLLNHLYRGGTAPPPGTRPDADCNGTVSLSDAVALIDYFFMDGEAPGAFCSWEIPAGLIPQGLNEQGFEEFVHADTGILLVLLPGGDFLMGTPEGEEGRWYDEGPLHTASLSAFLVGKYEVTQAEWEGVLGTNPSFFQGEALPDGVDSANLPVEQVSWDDVREFTALSGLSLPSEAQWEYACRAGTFTMFPWGKAIGSTHANYNGSGIGETTEGGQYPPNAWGFHDMIGNVAEWCADFYEPFTVHESSLSPCVHSIQAAKLGRMEQAYTFYLRTSRLDLDDYNHEVHEGLHITSMAGTWMSIVEGFGGMRIVDGKLSFEPRIPEQWSGYSFKVNFRNHIVKVKVSRGHTDFEIEGDEGLSILINGEEKVITPYQLLTV